MSDAYMVASLSAATIELIISAADCGLNASPLNTKFDMVAKHRIAANNNCAEPSSFYYWTNAQAGNL
jgi:hypothetical protein